MLLKTEAAATAFLKVANVLGTRLAMALVILLKRAYEYSGTEMALEDWAVVGYQQYSAQELATT